MGHIGLLGALHLSIAAAQSMPRKKPTPRVYSEPLGPPWPISRQKRRSMMREAAKAERLAHHKGKDHAG